MFEIDDDAPLVAMKRHEIRVIRARQGRAPGARKISRAGRFELDHLGAEISQHGGTKRPRERMGQVEHLDIFKWQLHEIPAVVRMIAMFSRSPQYLPAKRR